MEGRFGFLRDINQMFDSLIESPNCIDYLTRKLDRLDVGRGLDIMKYEGGDGAKIVHQMRPCTR